MPSIDGVEVRRVGGEKHDAWAVASMSSIARADLWTLRLSQTMTSPGLSTGTRHFLRISGIASVGAVAELADPALWR